MPFLVYRPTPFDNTPENMEFRSIAKALKKKYNPSNDLCILVGNYNVADRELDGFMITKDAVTLLEFKNCGGKVKMADNGDWEAITEDDGVEKVYKIKGGAGRKNPYQQAKSNRSAFVSWLTDSRTLTLEEAKKVSALIVFHQPVTEFVNRLSPKVQTWLFACDERGLLEMTEDIVNPELSLTMTDMKRMAENLGLLSNDYFLQLEHSNRDFLEYWNGLTTEEEIPFEESEEPEDELPSAQPPQETVPVEQSVPEEGKSSAKPVEEPAPSDNIPLMLVNYIKLIQNSIFPEVPYDVFDCLEAYPHVSFKISQRYLVRIKTEPTDVSLMSVSHFIHEDAYPGEGCIFWQIGDDIEPIFPALDNVAEEEPQSAVLSFRRDSAILPPWLSKQIFEKMGGTYAPQPKRYEYNADLSEEESLVYAGTYLPRSYAENFVIFDNLFQNARFKEAVLAKKRIRIFDLGSGSGGDVMGLLAAIDKYVLPEVPVDIIALDANKNSLNVFDGILKKYLIRSTRPVELKPFCEPILGPDTLEKYATLALPDKSIDFFICAKIGGELLLKNVFGEDNPYEVVLKKFMPKIADTGVLMLLDVTTKVSGGEYLPTIMNRGANHFVQNQPDFATMIPQSCNCYERNCSNPCFFQQEIYVSHSKKSKDLSKICYRILARREFCDAVIPSRGKRFIVTPSKITGELNDAYCLLSVENTADRDAFNANN